MAVLTSGVTRVLNVTRRVVSGIPAWKAEPADRLAEADEALARKEHAALDLRGVLIEIDPRGVGVHHGAGHCLGQVSGHVLPLGRSTHGDTDRVSESPALPLIEPSLRVAPQLERQRVSLCARE